MDGANQKKVPKKRHPEKPLLTEFVRSFEKLGPRLNSLHFIPLKQNPLSPEFFCIRSLASEGPLLYVQNFMTWKNHFILSLKWP